MLRGRTPDHSGGIRALQPTVTEDQPTSGAAAAGMLSVSFTLRFSRWIRTFILESAKLYSLFAPRFGLLASELGEYSRRA
jgi:hypothetical protein